MELSDQQLPTAALKMIVMLHMHKAPNMSFVNEIHLLFDNVAA
jgi:hypothetical protein